MTKLYIKCLMLDGNGVLESCNGGSQKWDATPVRLPPEEIKSELCAAGRIHVCRMRDFPAWIATHNVIVEVEGTDVLVGDNKVGVTNARIIRTAPEVDGLMLLARFAEFVSTGPAYTDEKGVQWLKAQYPAGFFDGVEA